MLAKQLAVGQGPVGLVMYLFGEGKANEHTDQRLVAASDHLIAGYAALDVASSRDMQAALAREFDGAWRQVRRERGLPLAPPVGEKQRGAARADRVYHAVLSLGPDEGALTDQEWTWAARMFVAEMGFIDSKDGADCAWLAVHHGTSKDGNDHLHIAVNMVREDGRRADLHQSKRRTAQAGARVAGAMGRDVAFDSEVTSSMGNVSRAEWERARREGREADRVLIRRRLTGAAWQATSEAEFVRIARSSGVIVRPRYAEGAIVRVVGYSVALDHGDKAVWFAPSKLDRSLGLPVLRERYGWDMSQQMDAVPIWRERAGAKTVGSDGLRLPLADEIKRVRVTLAQEHTEIRWRRAANDASAMLGAWSVQAEGQHGGYLGKASDALARAAQPRRSTSREAFMEGAQTVLAVVAASSKNDTAAQLAIIMQMMRLAEAIASSAAAAREAKAARDAYLKAVVPLNIQAGLIEYQAGQEKLQNADPELAEMMAATQSVMPRHHMGTVDYSTLSPETVKVLTGRGRAASTQRPSEERRAPAYGGTQTDREPTQER